jgi:hypothetical protein
MVHILGQIEHLTPEQEAFRATWQYRAVARIGANLHVGGQALIAALGPPWYRHDRVPRFLKGPTIKPDGKMVAPYIGLDLVYRPEFYFSPSPTHFQNDFRQLADDLKLTDKERLEMFDKLSTWIFKDERIVT